MKTLEGVCRELQLQRTKVCPRTLHFGNVNFLVSKRTPEEAQVLHVKSSRHMGWYVTGARHKMGIPCTNACHVEVNENAGSKARWRLLAAQ